MPVTVHEKTGIFHLHNEKISYLCMILPNGEMGQLYFGSRIHDREDFSDLLELGHRDMAPVAFDAEGTDSRVCWGSTTFSLEHIRQEYPSYGTGDMRQPAFVVLDEDGSRLSHFEYCGHRIYDGKEELPGLPATYVEDKSEAQTLVIELEDKVCGAGLELHYTIYQDLPVITRHAVWINKSAGGITSGKSSRLVLERAMSLNLDLPDSDYDMIDLAGASLRERYVDRHALHAGVQSIGSMRGHSSHQFNPFVALARPGTSETTGEVVGLSLVYSGNFLAQAEVDTMGVSRLMIGIHPQGFEWPLEAGESFCTPEAVLVYSDEGLGGMSRTFHKLFRTRLARGYWRDRERPIVINNWEATYMKFDEARILEIAAEAKKLGAEMFVLDDGWFGRRDDDSTSLGDWYPDLKKLPEGIAGLSEKVEALGMKFGLWIEPEMVSPESDLYRAHPEWVLGSDKRHICQGRHQLELDFSRQEVTDHLYKALEKLIAKSRVSYVKWDMNRSISDVFSRGNDAAFQGTVLHRQILGVYRLYERLTERFPEILFESCASGGGRFDPGMLYYAPQAWTSDDTDAAERVKIQYGTSLVYPLSSMSNHVSAVPNHQTFRTVSMFTRGAVAAWGSFGYELDATRLTEEEQEEVKAQIGFIQRWRGYLQRGEFYRLSSPFAGNETGWMVAAPDRKSALVMAYRDRQPVNAGYRRMKLQGLDPDLKYQVKEADHKTWAWNYLENGARASERQPLKHYGDELMKIGLLLSDAACGVRTSQVPQEDAQARIFLVEAI